MDKESKNGHSGAEKTNRFQSGFVILQIFFSNRTNSKQEKIRIPCLPSFMYVLPFYLKLLAGAEQARVFSIVILAFRAGVLQKELL